MKNNKKALSSTPGLFYIQDEWYAVDAQERRYLDSD